MLPPSPAVASRDKRTQAKATAWLRGAALACGVLAAMVWSGALAAGPIEDALSLVDKERYSEARELVEPLLEREPTRPVCVCCSASYMRARETLWRRLPYSRAFGTITLDVRGAQ